MDWLKRFCFAVCTMYSTSSLLQFCGVRQDSGRAPNDQFEANPSPNPSLNRGFNASNKTLSTTKRGPSTHAHMKQIKSVLVNPPMVFAFRLSNPQANQKPKKKQEKPTNPNKDHVKETDATAGKIKCRCGLWIVECGV